jgi:flagellar hook assembly protein FlgD
LGIAAPNPFNPQTTISYSLGAAGDGELAIYDLAGRRVKTLVSGYVDAGQHEAQWGGRDEQGRRVASGVYLYRLVAGDFVETRRMVLLK